MNSVTVKLKTTVAFRCDGAGCGTVDESEMVVHITNRGVYPMSIPSGWKKHMVFTVRSTTEMFCPCCVAGKLADEWVQYQADEYIGLPCDEGTWFGK